MGSEMCIRDRDQGLFPGLFSCLLVEISAPAVYGYNKRTEIFRPKGPEGLGHAQIGKVNCHNLKPTGGSSSAATGVSQIDCSLPAVSYTHLTLPTIYPV